MLSDEEEVSVILRGVLHGYQVWVLFVPNWSCNEKNRNCLLACERASQWEKVRDWNMATADVTAVRLVTPKEDILSALHLQHLILHEERGRYRYRHALTRLRLKWLHVLTWHLGARPVRKINSLLGYYLCHSRDRRSRNFQLLCEKFSTDKRLLMLTAIHRICSHILTAQ